MSGDMHLDELFLGISVAGGHVSGANLVPKDNQSRCTSMRIPKSGGGAEG